LSGHARRLLPALGMVPFLGYLTIFLFIPTVVIAVGAFRDNGHASLANIEALGDGSVMHALRQSLVVSASTAVIGAVLGALLAYAVVTGRPDGLLRRAVTSICGVLAQFGGVMLAFAFIATIGFSGAVTTLVQDTTGVNLFGSGWLFDVPGIILVYTYFQIPLMVIVFLPALDGMRAQWREAAENLGASTWQFWRHVGGPLLWPAFLGSTLLLFANAFASYATAAALVSQGNPIIPLFIRAALTSEILLGRQNLAYALALEMVVVVAIVMTLYALLVRRTSRWLR
jgi:putative spermidine/putrescine transport system permease protein